MLVFVARGKPEYPGETCRSKGENQQKLNPHTVSIPGFEPGPLWWEASAHTTAPPLAPRSKETGEKYVYIGK